MKLTYKHTMLACFVGYIVQAIVNNFVPLLFLTFQKTYGIPLTAITMLITINFGVQLLVDLASAYFVDKIGYRISLILAHFFSAAGFLCLTILPERLPNAYTGLLISVIVYAIGGGLLEVLVSPVVEACPTDNKEQAMSLLHSFYCWGHVGVVLISTLYFRFVGIEHWKGLTLLWMIVPLANLAVFTQTPIASLMEEGERGLSIGELLRNKVFWILAIMMVCSGASEQAVSQWASTLAEKGLGVTKAVGDLAGPMTFAVTMGTSRAFYGKFGDRMDLDRFMYGSCFLCVVSYLMISLLPNPALNLLGCAVCGLSVGIMWPGSFSKSAAAIPKGGTAMFAFLALGGDLGCSGGPTFAGMMASHFQDNLQMGILCSVIFPILLMGMIYLSQKMSKTK
ncbi:MAG: MFS transporter [Eubacteriales bacterium]|nr:MFS transporter [Eubacteriales bacterium]